MRIWRSHPVLFAALLGALLGFANALVLEIPALLGRPSKGVLSLLEPVSRYHAGAGVLETALLLLIEIGANVLVYAGIFAVFGLLFVVLRRMFRHSRQNETNDSPQP